MGEKLAIFAIKFFTILVDDWTLHWFVEQLASVDFAFLCDHYGDLIKFAVAPGTAKDFAAAQSFDSILFWLALLEVAIVERSTSRGE